MVACLGLGRWDVADRLEQAAIVEPTHPVEGGEFHGTDVSPRPAPTDRLGLERADDGLGEGIVVGIADAADGGLNACRGQALGMANRNVLAATDALLCVKGRCGSG